MTAASSINDDILIEILKRLPEKSLLRFKCVQKSWHRLIKSPHFISIYSDHKKNHGTATASAVSSATKKFEKFLNADPTNMAAVLAQLSYNWGYPLQNLHYNWGDYKKLQRELEGWQSLLKKAEEKYNHDPRVNEALSAIREVAFNVENALNSEFIEFMLRRRSVFERMLSGIFCCTVCNRRKSRIHNVFNGIKSLIKWLRYLKFLIGVAQWPDWF